MILFCNFFVQNFEDDVELSDVESSQEG